MFTGIIENTGRVEKVEVHGTNKTFYISSPLSAEFKVDQSVSHNGVCLTVEAVENDMHRVTAIEETLMKSNIGLWQTGDMVNIERCMQMNGRLDGHIVQGHVDATAVCVERKDMNGSWEFRFRFPEQFTTLVIEKGSIAVNGISLTLFNVGSDEFSVAIIPYTFEHTNMSQVYEDVVVNIEFDIIGKYIQRMLTR
ncbi:riboflavin synthase [Panacibacter ginsenosidivorans]|uniref:Riboflavin synthase n=1 Tax=Panacibacter ginsenosidivorans TaxID=1813871 RepID=A0A5B8V6D1_9BACT|nr:riboflavin synthase [Panacibacter ginsenosidivorans]QEC66822.1 riboflavin synthase [Panacibacter ginsenosidivorans]